MSASSKTNRDEIQCSSQRLVKVKLTHAHLMSTHYIAVVESWFGNGFLNCTLVEENFLNLHPKSVQWDLYIVI